MNNHGIYLRNNEFIIQIIREIYEVIVYFI